MRSTWTTIVLGFWLAACNEPGEHPFLPAGPDASPDPGLPGPFPVGVMTLEFSDPERTDGQGNPRRLVTEIWYPAVQSALHDPLWTYAPADEADPGFLGDVYQTLVEADLPGLPGHAVRDAGLEMKYAPYPLVVFAHSAYGIRWQSVFYTPHLASHGYIVVSCDHAGNTVWDLIRDGFSEAAIAMSAGDRIKDLDILLDSVLGMNNTPGNPFQGAVDHRRIGISGHSFGGWSAVFQACQNDRYDLAIAQAPPAGLAGLFGCDLENYPVPLMLIGGTSDQAVLWKDLYCEYQSVKAPERHLVEISDAGHNTFSDICDLDPDKLMDTFDPGPGSENMADGCRSGNVPWKAAHKNVNHYSTALFNVILRNSPVSRDYLKAGPADPVPGYFYTGDAPDWPGGCD